MEGEWFPVTFGFVIALSMEATHNGTYNTYPPPPPSRLFSFRRVHCHPRSRARYSCGGEEERIGEGIPVLFSLKGKYRHAPGAFVSRWG